MAVPGQAPTAPAPNTSPAPTPNPAPVQTPFDIDKYVPADLRGEKYWESFRGKDLGDVLKAGLEAHKAVGGRIPLPSEKDKPEDRQRKMEEIYNKLGRPDSPDKYQVQVNLPDYIGLDESFDKGFRAAAHKAGLTNDQVRSLYKFYEDYLVQSIPAPGVAKAQAEAALKAKWGEGAYPINHGIALAAVQKLGGERLAAKFQAAGLDNDPELIELFYNIGKELQEAGVIDPRIEGVRGVEDVQAEINKILNDKNDLYWKKGVPGHEERVRYVQGLYEQVHNT